MTTDSKIIKISVCILIILLVGWLAFLTFKIYKLEKIAGEARLTAIQAAAMSALSASSETNKSKIGGRYTYDKVDFFRGRFVAALDGGKVLIVYGSVSLNQEAIKDGGGAVPVPMETKYVYINKDTRLSGPGGKPFGVDGLTIDDTLIIRTKDSFDLGSLAFDAASITLLPETLPKQ